MRVTSSRKGPVLLSLLALPLVLITGYTSYVAPDPIPVVAYEVDTSEVDAIPDRCNVAPVAVPPGASIERRTEGDESWLYVTAPEGFAFAKGDEGGFFVELPEGPDVPTSGSFLVDVNGSPFTASFSGCFDCACKAGNGACTEAQMPNGTLYCARMQGCTDCFVR